MRAEDGMGLIENEEGVEATAQGDQLVEGCDVPSMEKTESVTTMVGTGGLPSPAPEPSASSSARWSMSQCR